MKAESRLTRATRLLFYYKIILIPTDKISSHANYILTSNIISNMNSRNSSSSSKDVQKVATNCTTLSTLALVSPNVNK